jgi:hypothetical protein
MNHSRLFFFLAAGICSAAPTFQVASQGGTHTNLQAAIDACPATGCRIELKDSLYTFTEPVAIRNKANLSIVGARANGVRPILTVAESAKELAEIPALGGNSPALVAPILWTKVPADTLKNPDGTTTLRSFNVAMGKAGYVAKFLLAAGRTASGVPDPMRPSGWMAAPFSAAFLKDPSRSADEKTGYLQAGLLQLDSCRYVRIEGISFQLDAPIEFGISVLWNQEYGQPGYLAAVSLHRSLAGIVRDCEFSGWSIGVRSVDDNDGGLGTDLMMREELRYNPAPAYHPLANPGVMGGHRIEGNLAHHNRIFVYLESAWDLSSSIRFNRAWDNGISRLVKNASVRNEPSFLDDGCQFTQENGVVMLQDVVYASTIMQGNTFSYNMLDMGTMGWRASTVQLFLDNVTQRTRDDVDWRELSDILSVNSRSNWFASNGWVGSSYPADTSIPFCTNSSCLPLTPAWGAKRIDEMLVGKGYFGEDLGSVWQTPRQEEMIRIQDQTLGNVTQTSTGWKVLLAVPVEASATVSGLKLVKAMTQKSEINFLEGIYYSNPPLKTLPALEGKTVTTGINLLSFEIPAAATDAIWRIELAVQGTDNNTGKTVHSNLGTWLVRPLGKQLQVTLADTGTVLPGAKVRFKVQVMDSLGDAASLASAPNLNANGWSLVPSVAPRLAGRTAASAVSSFEFEAIAPLEEGVKQVVFWGLEDGRVQAVPGAAYVQVGARTSGIQAKSAVVSDWKFAGTSRQGNGWAVQIHGATSAELAKAHLLDARGRSWNVGSSTAKLLLPALPSGSYFLSLGGKTRSLALVP